jgi:hypothetical protein
MKAKVSKRFLDWIDIFGVQDLARELKIDSSTISHWRRGTCWPQVKHMRRIRDLSLGEITYEHMIEEDAQ